MMAKDIEYLFMYLVAICISSLEKVLLIGSFVFLLLNCKSSVLYILLIIVIYQIYDLQICSLILWVALHFFDDILRSRKKM